jgi:hypothetical protein
MEKGKRGREIRPMRRSPGKKWMEFTMMASLTITIAYILLQQAYVPASLITLSPNVAGGRSNGRRSWAILLQFAKRGWSWQNMTSTPSCELGLCRAFVVFTKMSRRRLRRTRIIKRYSTSCIPAFTILNMEKTRVIDVGAGNTKINSMD